MICTTSASAPAPRATPCCSATARRPGPRRRCPRSGRDLSLHREGNYTEFQTSADGHKLLFQVSYQTFVSDADGGNRVGLLPDASQWNWRFVLGDTKVAWEGYEGSSAHFYTADLDGGNVEKIDYGLPAGREPGFPTFNSTGTTQYFISQRSSDNSHAIYSSAPDGSGLTQVWAATCANCNIRSFSLAPADSGLVVWGDLLQDRQDIIVTMNADGSGATTISDPMVTGSSVKSFSLTPDQGAAVFLADRETAGVDELYVAALDGSGLIKLSGAMVAGGSATSFAVSPTGDKVVYVADQESDEIAELYAVNLDGSGRIKISGDNPAGGSVQRLGWFFTGGLVGSGIQGGVITPDGQQVYFRGDLDLLGAPELYRAGLDGSGRIKINPAVSDSAGMVHYVGYYPSLDRVLFSADVDGDSAPEIYTARADGSELSRIDFEVALASQRPVFSPDGSAIHLGDGGIGNHETNYAADADGSNLREVGHDEASIDHDVEYVSLNPAQTHLVFLDGLAELGGSCWDIYGVDLRWGDTTLLSTNPRDPGFTSCDWGSLQSSNSSEVPFSADTLRPAQRVTMELHFDHASLVVDAEVVWTNPERQLAGMQFVDLLPSAVTTLREQLTTLVAAELSAGHKESRPFVLADADIEVETLFVTALNKPGREVVSCSRGDEAIDVIWRQRPAAVFMDVLVPEIDGARICRMMRADAELAHVPVLLSAPLDAETLRDVARDCGASDYLAKPFTITELSATLSPFLRR